MGRLREVVTPEQTRIDKTRTFGIEIEFIAECEMDEVAQAIREAGVDCYEEHYNHHTRDYWKIVEDSSLHCDYGYEPMELVSPPLCGREGLRELEKVCEVLDNLNCYTNISCGLHVHHDAVDYDMDAWRIFIKNVLKYEDTMDAFHPYDRRGSNWACKGMADGASLPRLFTRVDNSEDVWQMSRIWYSRYLKVNLEAFDVHGTIEFRQHEGTINFVDIAAWVSLTQGFVARAATGKAMRMRDTTKPFESLMLTANACASVRRHYAARYNP